MNEIGGKLRPHNAEDLRLREQEEEQKQDWKRTYQADAAGPWSVLDEVVTMRRI